MPLHNKANAIKNIVIKSSSFFTAKYLTLIAVKLKKIKSIRRHDKFLLTKRFIGNISIENLKKYYYSS